MSKHKTGKYWSPGLLKDRGWTNQLIAELLPKPVYRRATGRSFPTWHRDDVKRAEDTEAFKTRSKGKKPTGQDVASAQTAVTQAAAALAVYDALLERRKEIA